MSTNFRLTILTLMNLDCDSSRGQNLDYLTSAIYRFRPWSWLEMTMAADTPELSPWSHGLRDILTMKNLDFDHGNANGQEIVVALDPPLPQFTLNTTLSP